MYSRLFVCLGLASVISCNDNSADKIRTTPRDKFTDNIRTTEFRTPAQEQAGFKLPEGFEISLYASEPDIGKPINMEFDDRGRLWVTQSFEYPMPEGPGHGKDRLSILEDTDGDGKADKFTHFEDTLNIPIGLYPMTDGAIAYSIPAIHYYKDSNNDGKADQQKTLFSGFGYKDTHGMVSNLIRGFDGWIYSCHGFSNTSRIAGTDGDSLIMTSGNTFRFRPDGSHVELTSAGRVNPFGYAYDEYGYLYSVDCHSKPIYQIITGGEYPGFGKKAPGIGYAPEMMSYELGSTAISGLEYYIGEQFPEEYRNCFYSGDVVTCEINRNTVTYKGTTPISKREEDFVVSDDPWFRPVAITIGPDGAMYIADFYNRIIGHYEVALDHPGRDRISGRIWKITYTGNKAKKPEAVKDWSKASLDELIEGLNDPKLNLRMKIADRIADAWKEKAIEPLKNLLKKENITEHAHIQALWILSRLNALDDAILHAEVKNNNPIIRTHALRILNEKKKINGEQRNLIISALSDENPHVRRAAAVALGKFTDFNNIKELLDLYSATDTADTHLLYTSILSIRNNLKENGIIKKVVAEKWNEKQLDILTRAMQDAPSAEGASFLMNYIGKHNLPQDQMISRLEYIGRYLPKEKLDQVIKLIQQKFAGDADAQFILYATMRQGIAQSGNKPSAMMKQWGLAVAGQTLNNIKQYSDPWSSYFFKRDADYPNPWVSRDDFFYPMVPKFRVIYSERHGYLPTGVLVSRPFKLPPQLSMNIFDYSIHNTDARTGISNSSVRIRLQSNNEVIGEYRLNQQKPSKIEDVVRVNYLFDLKKWAGQEGYIEAVDSSDKGSFGIGNLNPQVVPIPKMLESELAERRMKAIEITTEYKSAELIPALKNLATASWMDNQVRIAAAGALVDIDPDRYKNDNAIKNVLAMRAAAVQTDESTTISEAVRKERDKIIAERLKSFAASAATVTEGKSVFVQNCSMCHSINGTGGMIAPQLDGIGNWGAKALATKVLDPNRNISEAFRMYNITLKTGKQLKGLYRRTEGQATVYADISGKEFTVEKSDIKESVASKTTLMPDHFRNTISEQDFNALLKYLTSVK